MTKTTGKKRKAGSPEAATVLGTTTAVPPSGEVGPPGNIGATPKFTASNGSGHKQLEQQHHRQVTGSSTSSSSPAGDGSNKVQKKKKKKKRKLEESGATAARSVKTAEGVEMPAPKSAKAEAATTAAAIATTTATAVAVAPARATSMAASVPADGKEATSVEVLPTTSSNASMEDAAAVRSIGGAPQVCIICQYCNRAGIDAKKTKYCCTYK